MKEDQRKVIGARSKVAMQDWILKNILAGTDIKIRFTLGENRKQ